MIKYLNATDFKVRVLFEDGYELKTPCEKEHDLTTVVELKTIKF